MPGSGSPPGEGSGSSLQYSCLENSIDRGAWWATIHGVAKSQAWLKGLTVPRSLSLGLYCISTLSGGVDPWTRVLSSRPAHPGGELAPHWLWVISYLVHRGQEDGGLGGSVMLPFHQKAIFFWPAFGKRAVVESRLSHYFQHCWMSCSPSSRNGLSICRPLCHWHMVLLHTCCLSPF